MKPGYQCFWGKARPHQGASSHMHPLIAHALDVAAVAVLYTGSNLGLDGRTLGWLISLHDIGKFSRSFQAQAPEHWPMDVLGRLDPTDLPPPGPKHDALALHLLHDAAGDLLNGALPPQRGNRRGWTGGDRARLFRAIAGHHGRPVAKSAASDRAVGEQCEASARAFIAAMSEVFRPPPLLLPVDGRAFAKLEWSLAGLTILADWIGSRQAWFPYVDASAISDPAAYLWTHALPRAAAALSAAGLAAARPAPFGGLQRLFPGVKHLSPVQHWAESVALPPGPVLAVIEDLTGSGKTEAAMTLAHRLLASGRASGVFLALPTMATANAMFDRMADAYRHLFKDEARPSLALVHGRAALDPRFAPAFEAGAELGDTAADAADQPAEFHCAAWLAEDRRRALLAQVGVGTIDQALLAVLPVRHATLRLQGLQGKVLVVDEAHAFDPYMRRELVELLHFHAALGGSVILLSATLPIDTRRLLVNAYRKGLGAAELLLVSQDYPLATLTGAESGIIEQHCAPRDGLPRIVGVTRLPDATEALARVVQAERAGAAVAWVRNTVDDALAAAALLRAEGIQPLVFHARFALCDRLVIETEVLRRFGRDGEVANRPGVLVATQVVEQSLDLDFDLLCTDLAPVDRLIQRAGRLWRHDRRGQRPLTAPELLVVSPEPVAAPGPDWIRDVLPGTASVYADPALLWRSARAIFARGVLSTPDDMRPMIEEVADVDAPDAVPPGLAFASNMATGKDTAAAGVAGQNVLRFRDGYRPDAGAWEPDTRTSTRLEDRPQITLRLALLHEGRIVPYAQMDGDIRRAWSLSEVTVAQHRLATCPVPPELQAAALKAMEAWGRWERESDRFVLALLRTSGADGAYTLEGRAGSGKPVYARYTLQEGLCWQAGP